jgi:hypothetical protein
MIIYFCRNKWEILVFVMLWSELSVNKISVERRLKKSEINELCFRYVFLLTVSLKSRKLPSYKLFLPFLCIPSYLKKIRLLSQYNMISSQYNRWYRHNTTDDIVIIQQMISSQYNRWYRHNTTDDIVIIQQMISSQYNRWYHNTTDDIVIIQHDIIAIKQMISSQ